MYRWNISMRLGIQRSRSNRISFLTWFVIFHVVYTMVVTSSLQLVDWLIVCCFTSFSEYCIYKETSEKGYNTYAYAWYWWLRQRDLKKRQSTVISNYVVRPHGLFGNSFWRIIISIPRLGQYGFWIAYMFKSRKRIAIRENGLFISTEQITSNSLEWIAKFDITIALRELQCPFSFRIWPLSI